MHRKDIMLLTESMDEAKTMLNELESTKLLVVLSGHPGDQNRARSVESKNPEWYRDLFSQYHNGKKGRRSNAGIRRPRVLKALKALARGQYRNYFIYDVLVDEIYDRISQGYYLEEFDTMVPPTYLPE